MAGTVHLFCGQLGPSLVPCLTSAGRPTGTDVRRHPMPDDDEQQPDRHDSPDDTPIEDTSGERPVAEHTGDASAEHDDPDDEGDVESTDPSEGMPQPRPLSLAARNLTTLGQLTLHYPSRDVTVLLDGDAALRLLTMFSQRREGGLADPLDPEMSEAAAGWVVLDLDEPLAMSWLPGLPGKRPRTSIDPAVAAA
jgi:hypothetical protein